jgi:hypothetical protein
VWNFLYTIEGSDVIKGVDAGGETSVEAEDLVVDQGSEGKVVEEIGEVLPYVGIAVFSKALIIKPIDLCDLAGLVVATEDGDALRISNFQSHKESDGFNGIVTSINIIAHEQIIRVWIWPANSEQLHQVMELTMDVSAYGDWAFHWLHVRLVLQDLSCLLAEPLYIDLGQLLTGHQALNPSI